ncbi:hypothetical protein IE4771_CH02485 [Rhizobium etli bv. mimosae str. IE4771]|uniref:Uncharacterized protein n=1 Tax=Rhizobium etli bv. mimosae str. IE4771 TaxID=1432050 RepID=A0A060HXG4_RHIET|nr:hypothetical protein IE4771_CH02485 [Rhizobium sp. IE4771]ARQ58527.1 hypothetical protein Kim5_CH02480 [Rhizobium sp. Kim5]
MIHCRLRARLFLEFPPYINRILATVWKWGMDEVFVERVCRGYRPLPCRASPPQGGRSAGGWIIVPSLRIGIFVR